MTDNGGHISPAPRPGRLFTLLKSAPWAAYLLAVLLPVLVVAIRLRLGFTISDDPALIFLVLPFVLCAYLGGAAPGFLATFVSCLLSAYYLLTPQYSFLVTEPLREVEWLALILLGALVSVLSEGLHRARRRAENSDEQLHLMLHNAHDYALFSLAPDGRVASWNAGAQRAKGYSSDEIVGRHFAAFYTPEDQARGLPMQLLQRATAENYVVDQGWRMRKDGTRFWASVIITALRDQYGNLRGFSKLTRDISEQKQADQRIAYQAGLLEHINDAIIATDAQLRITSWNHAAEAIYGWQAEEAIGQPSSVVLQTQYSNEQRDELLRQVMERGSWQGEVRQKRKDSASIDIMAAVSLILSEHGSTAGLVSVNRDITERKAAEAQLRAYTTRLQMLADASRVFAEASTDYQTVVDRVAEHVAVQLKSVGVILLLSDDAQFLRLAAVYDPDVEAQALIRTIFASHPLPVGSSHPAALVFRSAQAQVLPDIQPERLRPMLAPEYWPAIDQFGVQSTVMAPIHMRGQNIGVLALIRREQASEHFSTGDLQLAQDLADRAGLALANAHLFMQAQQELAERKRAEAALEHERALLAERVAERTASLSIANAELARAARLKDEFLASMSHELRTPLNSVLGRSEILQEGIYGPLTHKQREAITGIEESGRHLLSLINDILDLSKIEADKLEIQLAPVAVQPLMAASLQLVAQTAAQKRIQVVSSTDSKVMTLSADERRLKQILVNLLSNAVKFTPQGGRIGLELTGDPARETATFSVWDTGIGISQEDLPKLFKPFVQIDSSLSRQYEGTGLGLALVLRLAQAHGGSVAVDSTPGQGSRFSVTIPWLPSPDQAAANDTDAAPAHTRARVVRRALVIEDMPVVANQVARYLQELGAQATILLHGRDAVAQASALQPELIVLDIVLPDTSGWEVLRALKAKPRTREIPVVILSVVDEPERGRALGAAAYLVKPIDRAALAATIQRVLQRPTAPSGAPEQAAEPARPRILLAEDNQANIDAVLDYLRMKGFDVVVARNGLEALERAQEQPPEIILMDVQMPVMDGLEATRRIRADARLQHVPIIALTALAMPGDRESCLQAGADDYLSKPVSLRTLFAIIESQLRSRSQGAFS